MPSCSDLQLLNCIKGKEKQHQKQYHQELSMLVNFYFGHVQIFISLSEWNVYCNLYLPLANLGLN